MSNKIALILLVTYFVLGMRNSKPEFYFPDFVECYNDEASQDPIIIYDAENGQPIDTLEKLAKEMCWYKLAVSESKNGFLKLENISVFPSCMTHWVNSNENGFKGFWVKNQHMCINIADLDVNHKDGISFYEKPEINSPVVFQSGKFLKTTLIIISGSWAKVSFINEGRTIEGWLQKEDQCPYAWTSCPKTTE